MNSKKQFLSALLKIINSLGDEKLVWAGILYTVAAAVEIDKDIELAKICHSFINILKKELIEKKSKLKSEEYKNNDNITDLDDLDDLDILDDLDVDDLDDLKEFGIIEENYEQEENYIDGFVFNKEGHS